MTGLFSESKREKRYLCDIVFMAYLLFVAIQYYSFYLDSSILTPALVNTSDADEYFNLFAVGQHFTLSMLTFKNMFYTFFFLLSKNYFFSYLFASFMLYAVSIVLVYLIANMNRIDRYVGLFAVFLFTTMTDIFLPVVAGNVHLAEMMFLLLIFYLYGKSFFFSIKSYSVLYVLICGVALFERESISVHLSILVFVTSFFLMKNKKYFLLKYNFWVIVLICLKTFYGQEFFYVGGKLDHWGAWFYTNDMLSRIMFPLLSIRKFCGMLVTRVSYFWFLSVIFYMVCKLFCRYEKEDPLLRSLDFYVGLSFLLYLVTIDVSVASSPYVSNIDDILPLFAFFPIIVVRFFYHIKSMRVLSLFVLFTLIGGIGYFKVPSDLKDKFKFNSIENVKYLVGIASEMPVGFCGPVPEIVNEIEIARRQNEYELMLFMVGQKGVDAHKSLMIKTDDGLLLNDFDSPVHGREIKMFLGFVLDLVYIENMLAYCNSTNLQSADFLKSSELNPNYIVFCREHRKIQEEEILGIKSIKMILDGNNYNLYFVKVLKSR